MSDKIGLFYIEFFLSNTGELMLFILLNDNYYVFFLIITQKQYLYL